MRRLLIPGEDESQRNKHPHWEWGCDDSPEMPILIGNEDVPHWEWGCDSSIMFIHTGNGDVPRQECTSSAEVGMCLTGNAHSLYRVLIGTSGICVNISDNQQDLLSILQSANDSKLGLRDFYIKEVSV